MCDFTILVLEGAYASGVSTSVDMLTAASALASKIRVPAPTWNICSTTGGSIELQSGMSIKTSKLQRPSKRDASTWIIPGLGLDKISAIETRVRREDVRVAINAIRLHVKNEGNVAAACSSVFLLREAALLDGKRVTTSWWLAPELKRSTPKCIVNADRMVCVDGQLTTAGAAFAQTDLMLHLIRVLCGNALADAVSKILLVDGRQAQAPFLVPEAFSNGDDLIGRLAVYIEDALPHLPKVGDLAKEFFMTERTLARRIQKATGQSTLALMQSVKQRRARTLLESSRLTVEQIAAVVGYQDATALRRLMQKFAGANPSKFRATTAHA
jgi:transcriptional regulator GlxA family with amidase domain